MVQEAVCKILLRRLQNPREKRGSRLQSRHSCQRWLHPLVYGTEDAAAGRIAHLDPYAVAGLEEGVRAAPCSRVSTVRCSAMQE